LKRRFSKILGAGIVVTLLASLIVAAIPVAANVSQPTLPTVDPDEISEVDVNYVIGFRLTDDLTATDTITIRFPDDTGVPDVALIAADFDIAASPGWIGGVWKNATVGSVTAAGDADERTVVFTLVGTDEIGEGSTVRIEFLSAGTNTITNPSEPGDYTLEVKTSEETTYVESESYEIVSPTVGGWVYCYNPSDILVKTYGGEDALDDAVAYFDKEDYTITVGAGTYTLAADITIGGEGLTFKSSDGAADTIIDASAGVGIQLAADDITVDGFTIDDADSAIQIGAEDAVIQNLVITDATVSGIAFAIGGLGATISDNTIEDCAIGIAFAAGASTDFDATISDNVISETSTTGAIVFGGGNDDITISGNDLSGNDVSGIVFADSVGVVVCDDNLIKGNTISENDADGIAIETAVAPTNLEISENDIADNGVVGIDVDSWTLESDVIFLNNISGNTDDGIDSTGAAADVNAIFNWWGSSDADDVADDINDDAASEVIYEPFLTGTFGSVFSVGDVTTDANSFDAKTAAGVKVSGVDDGVANGNDGADLIIASQYAENPQEIIDDALAFFDVFVGLNANFDSNEDVTVKVKFYDTSFTESSVASWWTGDFWDECSDQEARGGLVWVSVTEDTSPTIEELGGTEFVVVATPATMPVLALTAPAAGATDIPLTNVPFTWSSVSGADSYLFLLSENADLSSAIIREPVAGTAYLYTGTLTDGNAYYWQVLAREGTINVAESDVGAFIAKAPVEAAPPAVMPAPEVTVEAPPAPQVTVEAPPAPSVTVEAPVATTPSYIWAIIGIGAVLVIAVVVLIVRTRRAV